MAKGKKTGGGNRRGVPNKATANAREAIARFVDDNAGRLQGWLDQIAQEEGPAAAFACVKDMIEFHVPKLARTELGGVAGNEKGDGQTSAAIVVTFIGTQKPQ